MTVEEKTSPEQGLRDAEPQGEGRARQRPARPQGEGRAGTAGPDDLNYLGKHGPGTWGARLLRGVPPADAAPSEAARAPPPAAGTGNRSRQPPCEARSQPAREALLLRALRLEGETRRRAAAPAPLQVGPRWPGGRRACSQRDSPAPPLSPHPRAAHMFFNKFLPAQVSEIRRTLQDETRPRTNSSTYWGERSRSHEPETHSEGLRRGFGTGRSRGNSESSPNKGRTRMCAGWPVPFLPSQAALLAFLL